MAAFVLPVQLLTGADFAAKDFGEPEIRLSSRKGRMPDIGRSAAANPCSFPPALSREDLRRDLPGSLPPSQMGSPRISE